MRLLILILGFLFYGLFAKHWDIPMLHQLNGFDIVFDVLATYCIVLDILKK